MTKTTTYFTFGIQYSTEPHPSGPTAHPDGWWEVVGTSYEAARDIVHALTAGKYAFAYPEEDFQRRWHPRGCLRRITVENF